MTKKNFLCRSLIFLCVYFLFSCPLNATEKKTICLNMIVKNEKSVICDCLNSVKPIIDYWVIVDTGSSDGTQEIIKECMKGIPGELYERPWKNFEHNRNEALDLAKEKSDYCLIMDADDYLAFDPAFHLPELTADGYQIHINLCDMSWDRIQIINMKKDWRWKGVLHEYLTSDNPCTLARLDHVSYVATRGGARSKDPKKYIKDAAVLEEALRTEPNNSRYMFYLAQSYRDADMPEKALECYQKRVTMGGWDEETYISLIRIAQLEQILQKPSSDIIAAYFTAYRFRPSRAEALYTLADLLNNNRDHAIAYGLLKSHDYLPTPTKDILFRHEWMEKWGLMFQESISAYHIQQYQESLDLCDELLKRSDLPEAYKKAVERNRVFAVDKLAENNKTLALVELTK